MYGNTANYTHRSRSVASERIVLNITRSSATADIARVGGHYAVEGHSKSLKARMRLVISE